MDQPFIHWSAQPLGLLKSARQADHPHFKPMGLWFSVGDGDDGWRASADSERFASDRFKFATEITLRDDARVLRLSSAAEILAFSHQYLRPCVSGVMSDYKQIGWREVADKYQAIIIAPYVWECRLNVNWYYTWDCASGCVWDAGAVEALKPRPDLLYKREAA